MRRALPPACSISNWHKSSSGLLRASRPTRAPAAAKPIAKRLPMPRPAPVTSTGLLLKDCTYITVVQNRPNRDRTLNHQWLVLLVSVAIVIRRRLAHAAAGGLAR